MSWKSKATMNAGGKTPSKNTRKMTATTPGKPPRQRPKEKDPVEVWTI